MSESNLNLQIEEYFRCLFQDSFKSKCKSVESFYITIYECLWNYYIGAIPQFYNRAVPIANIRNIQVSFVISERLTTNIRIVVESNYNQIVEIGISMTDQVRETIKTMFGNEFYFGEYSTKEANNTEDHSLKDNVLSKWNKWVYNPIMQIDSAATNPDSDNSVNKYFRNLYYTVIVTNINLFVAMILYDINNANKNSIFVNQFNKYTLLGYDQNESQIKLKLANRSGMFVDINLMIPIGIQEHIDSIKENLNSILDIVFIHYNNSDSTIPDQTIQSIGLNIFPYARSLVNSFDQVAYYSKPITNTVLGDALNKFKEKIENNTQENTVNDTSIQVQEEKITDDIVYTDDKYSKSVIALLSGRIPEYQIFTSRVSLFHCCYTAIKTLFEVSTDISFVYNVRVYKRLSRDKFHTLSVSVFNSFGIIVNFSVKVFLNYEDTHKRKGVVAFICGNDSDCIQHSTFPIIEECNSEVIVDCITNSILRSNWFTKESLPNTTIESRGALFKSNIKDLDIKKTFDKFISQNSAYRFTLWPIVEFGGVYFLIDGYVRVDLQKTFLLSCSDRGDFFYSSN